MISFGRYRRQLRGTGLVTLSNMASTGLGLVLLLCLARILEPAELAIVLGVIAIIDGGQMFLDTVINAGVITLASKRHKDGEPDHGILRAGFWSKLGVGAILMGIVACFAAPLSEAMVEDTSIAHLIIAAAGGTLLAGMQTFSIAVLQTREQFGRIALLTPVKNAARIGVVLIALLMGTVDIGTLALGMVAATGLALLVSIPFVSWRFLPGTEALKSSAMDLARMNGWMLLSAFVFLAGRYDIWIVGYLSSAEQAGKYAVAAQLCVGVGVLTQALMTTFLPTVSRFTRAEEAQAFLKGWFRIAPVVFLIPLLVWPVAGSAIALLFGEAYRDSATMFIVLLVSNIIGLFGAPLMMVLLSTEQTKILALGGGVQLLFRLLIAVGLVPLLGGVGMALSDVLGRLLAIAVLIYFILEALKSGFEKATPPTRAASGTAAE